MTWQRLFPLIVGAVVRYPPGVLNQMTAQLTYPQYNLHFLGNSRTMVNRQQTSSYNTGSFDQCLQKFVEDRKADVSYNGFFYTTKAGRTRVGTCVTIKGDDGENSDPDPDVIHYIGT